MRIIGTAKHDEEQVVLKLVSSMTLEFKEDNTASMVDRGTFNGNINPTVTDGGSFFGDHMNGGTFKKLNRPTTDGGSFFGEQQMTESEGKEEREINMNPFTILGEK